MLAERGDSLPVHEKARAENLAAEARQALKEEAPLDRLKTLSAELQQVYQILGASATGPAPQAEPEVPPPSDDGDDVIDAEFTAHE